MGAMPFVVAGLREYSDEWGLEEIIESKESDERIVESMGFLKSAVENSGLDEELGKRVIEAGEEISESTKGVMGPSDLSILSKEMLQRLQAGVSGLGLSSGVAEVIDSVDEGINRLEEFEEAEAELRDATEGSGIGEKAEELRGLATELGSVQAEVARLKGVVEQCKVSIAQIEGWIGKLMQNNDPESRLNKRLTRVSSLIELCSLVVKSARSDFASPLEEAFAEGFELLSRKSGNLEAVDIDTTDYSVSLSMKGFEGNWLDRGLSATERQHVGLSLVYALRRSSTKWSLPLPVVVDTPTSRMDKRHKGWSVTKFYPKLSNQVIVFATSDDLSDGLFEELEESGSLGLQYLITEVSDNSVKVVNSNLSAFFGG